MKREVILSSRILSRISNKKRANEKHPQEYEEKKRELY